MNQEAIYKQWLTYKPMWHKWARQMARTDYMIEDWEQQSYEVFIKAVATYDHQQGISLNAYYRMMLYRWGKHYFTKKKDYLLATEEGVNEVILQKVDETIDIEQTYLTQELAEVLELISTRLSEKERQIIYQFYIEEKDLKTVARSQGMTYKAVEKAKSRALHKLATMLKARKYK